MGLEIEFPERVRLGCDSCRASSPYEVVTSWRKHGKRMFLCRVCLERLALLISLALADPAEDEGGADDGFEQAFEEEAKRGTGGGSVSSG